jgi:hypothetical protein
MGGENEKKNNQLKKNKKIIWDILSQLGNP